MNEVPLLTICIPTYERAPMLDKCLAALHDIQSQGHTFNLIVGDNGSTDTTQEILEHWQPRFRNMTIITHDQPIGFDRNAASLYLAVKTKYCWLLGDCDTISEQNFTKIENHLKDGYDAVVINTDEVNIRIKRKIYSTIEDFITEQGWHVTKLSACVVQKQMLNPTYIERYYDSHFTHWGNLMEELCRMGTFSVLYDPDIPLGYLVDDGNYKQSQKGAWRQLPFYVWGRCWSQMVLSLPIKIPYELKMKVIKDHERKYHWFSLKNIIKNKIKFGEPYIKNYKENRQFVKMVTVASPVLSDWIMYLPIEPVFKMLISLKNRIISH